LLFIYITQLYFQHPYFTSTKKAESTFDSFFYFYCITLYSASTDRVKLSLPNSQQELHDSPPSATRLIIRCAENAVPVQAHTPELICLRETCPCKLNHTSSGKGIMNFWGGGEPAEIHPASQVMWLQSMNTVASHGRSLSSFIVILRCWSHVQGISAAVD
jgi:hypothetical protein